MRRFVFGCALLLALVPLAATPAAAQPQRQPSLYRFELTPTVSYRFGGTLRADRDSLFATDLRVDNSAGYGLTFDIPLSSGIQLELLANRQPGRLRVDRGLFGGSAEVADIDVSYYHVGMLWQWGNPRVTPFFTLSAGATSLEPKVPGARGEDRFSLSMGGGVKVFFSENVGLRFDGRGFWTDLGSYGGRRDSCRFSDSYYYDGRCYGNDFSQGQASLGLIFAW
jgi:opacity protein-like surface antigen